MIGFSKNPQRRSSDDVAKEGAEPVVFVGGPLDHRLIHTRSDLRLIEARKMVSPVVSIQPETSTVIEPQNNIVTYEKHHIHIKDAMFCIGVLVDSDIRQAFKQLWLSYAEKERK